MLKNREASNPYRVPPQPTPVWIKICISCLFVWVLGLMGAVLFNMVGPPRCSQVCDSIPNTKEAKPKSISPKKSVVMADEGSSVKKLIENDNTQRLVKRVDSLTAAVARMQSRVSVLEESYRTSKTREFIEDSPTGTSSSSNLSPTELSIVLNKVPQLEANTRDLEAKLTKYMSVAKKVCKSGHYRFGVHCYVVVDAALTQHDAKSWCKTNYGDQANLAIIKDKLAQDFISKKLPDRLHSYWIGIERQSPANYGNFYQPLYLSTSVPMTPLGIRSNQFEYGDGTRVQNKSWQMWRSKTDIEDDGTDTGPKNCAGLSYDRSSVQWRWDEKICTERMGYVCQYYIMTP